MIYMRGTTKVWCKQCRLKDMVLAAGVLLLTCQPLLADDWVIGSPTTLTDVSTMQGANVSFEMGQQWDEDTYMILYRMGTLTVDASATTTWNIGKFTLPVDFYNYDSNYFEERTENIFRIGSLVNLRTPIHANSIEAVLADQGYMDWTFFSVPFDVNMSDINPHGKEQWVVRRYDGQLRAEAKGGQTWVDVQDNEMLHANQGYIIMRDYSNFDYDNWDELAGFFTLPAADTENKQRMFSSGDITIALQYYEAKRAHNADWNFVGNPYPCYFRLGDIEEQAIITIYDEEELGYRSYSTVDDADNILKPMGAFFVQATNIGRLTFRASGRQADYTEIEIMNRNDDRGADYAPHRAMASDRIVLNITLTDGHHEDRTRLVVNNEASRNYEANRDACKFMSNRKGIPQIFTLEGDVSYAINERPVDNETIALGYVAGEGGQHTLHLQDCQTAIMLTDHLTGTTTDLSQGDYIFEATSGTDTTRFTLTIGQTTSLQQPDAPHSDGSNSYYNIKGQQVSQPANRGIYINQSHKAIVR